MDILDEAGIKATFFVLGQIARMHGLDVLAPMKLAAPQAGYETPLAES